MEPHPRFHRGGTFYSGFPARHAWCQAWQAGTPARPSDAEHLQDAKYGAACPGLSGEIQISTSYTNPKYQIHNFKDVWNFGNLSLDIVSYFDIRI
jgi:hypothetical protein